MGLGPLTGVPLPFFSYGGSYMLSLWIALGLAQRVAIESNVEISKNCFISPMMLTHYEKLKRTPSFLNTLILSHYFETDFKKIKWVN